MMPLFRKRVMAAVAVFAGLSLAAACSSDSDSGSSTTTAQAGGSASAPAQSGGTGTCSLPGNKFIYYAALDETGPVANFTAAEIEGFQLAIDKVNSEGGILNCQVELHVENDGSDATQAVSNLQKFLSSGQLPNSVYAGSSSTVVLSILPILTDNKIVSLSPPNSQALLDKPQDFPYGFGINIASAATADFQVKEFSKAGYKKMAMIYADSATGEGSFKAYEAALGAAGIELVGEKYKEDSLDMTPQLESLKAQNPDALIVNAYQAPTLYVFQSRATLGWDLPTYADGLAGSYPLAKNLSADQLKNVFVALPASNFADAPHPEGLQALIDAAKSGKQADQFAAYGYSPWAVGWDSIMVARAVFDQVGTTDAPTVSAFLQGGKFEKPTGDLLSNGKDAVAIDYCWSAETHFPCATADTYVMSPPQVVNENGFYVDPK